MLEEEVIFEVGDIVGYKKGCRNFLTDGSHIYYGSAIVIKTDPLVLVSKDYSMRWQFTVVVSQLEKLGQATEAQVKAAMKRL